MCHVSWYFLDKTDFIYISWKLDFLCAMFHGKLLMKIIVSTFLMSCVMGHGILEVKLMAFNFHVSCIMSF